MPDLPKPESLFVRLYLDRHIKKQLALDLRSRGFDVLPTEEAGMDTALDEAQLDFATKENRAILTFNIRDFAALHQEWTAAGRPHAGIIVSQQLGPAIWSLAESNAKAAESLFCGGNAKQLCSSGTVSMTRKAAAKTQRRKMV